MSEGAGGVGGQEVQEGQKRGGEMQEYEVVPADPKLRRTTVIVLAIIVLSGGAALYWLDSVRSEVEEWAREDPASAIDRLKVVLQVLFIAMGVIPVAVGVFLMRISRRVLEQRRYPPSGMRVIVNTVVIRGVRARRIALAGIVCSALLVVGGVVASVMGWRVLEMIGS